MTKRIRRMLVIVLSILTASAPLMATTIASATPTFTSYTIPTAGAGPQGIVSGRDGALWFAEANGQKIGRITTGGTFTEFPVSSFSQYGASIANIVPDQEGALWFIDANTTQVERIQPSGNITRFNIPTSFTYSDDFFITAGPDGALWFTLSRSDKIGRITTSGTVTEYPVPTPNAYPSFITTGPDGALWFGESSAHQMGRITTSGTISEFPIPSTSSIGGGITPGPDGALWFIDALGNNIGRMTTSGSVSLYPVSVPNIGPMITTGPDGALWFTEYPNSLGRITVSGDITEYQMPTTAFSPAVPWGIALGPDNALWVTDFDANIIVRADLGLLPAPITEYPVPPTVVSGQPHTAQPLGITTGSDGALWFTDRSNHKIGRMSTEGNVTEYALGVAPNSAIALGPDGAIWFTESTVKIGKIDPSGVLTEYPTPVGTNSECNAAAAGPDGALWFACGNQIMKVTTSGVGTLYPVPGGRGAFGMAVGPDGAIWFTENVSQIGKITTSGVFTIYTSPDGGGQAITTGPDSALWYTQGFSVDKSTTSGTVTRHLLPEQSSYAAGITSGPDSALWFTEPNTNKIGHMTTGGQLTEYVIPTPNSNPQGITVGPDGAIWFTESNTGKIGRFGIVPHVPTNLTASSPAQVPSLSWSVSSDATSYNIYRNGTQIDSTTNTTYTDSSAPEGTDTYYVTAVNSGGESAPSSSVAVVVDRTAPNVVGTPDSSPNSNGWYNHDLTITWNSTDPSPSSGAPAQPASTTATLEGDHTYTSDQSCDPAANCAVGSLELKIDKISPIITYSVAPVPNITGWNSGDVTVTFTCSDAASGIDSCPAPVTVSAEGASQTVSGTATDKAGNTATATVSVSLDKTAPIIAASLSHTPNANGWLNSPTTVSYNCTDALSGIATCPSDQTESTDGTYALSGTAADNAGNTATATTQVNIDQTAPDITYTVSPALNSNGWSNSSSVTVTFNCTDALSGVGSCTDPVILTGDGAYVVTGTAVDNAGNSTSINALVGIDTTQPTITASVSPAPNTDGWNNGGPVTVTFVCSDATSGVASCPSPQVVTTDGSYTLSGTTVDNAGNTATAQVNVNLDQTAPVVSNVSWSANPLMQGQNTILSANVADNLSGVARAYYTVNGGTAQAMVYDSASNTWKATFGSSLASNTYTVDVFAVDYAGNTSTPFEDILTVSSNSALSGHARLVPTASDTLPIALDTSIHNPAEFVLGFSGNNNGPNSIEAHYIVKNNTDEFNFSSTSVNWAVIPDGTHASIMVHGDMTTYINGAMTVTQNVAMRVDVTLGTGGVTDLITVKIWNPGQNTNTVPAYQVSEYDLANKSQVNIQ